MKNILIIACLLMASVAAMAQTDYPSKGYRGFVEASSSIGMGDYDAFNHAGITTSHGVQMLSGHMFIGAGLGAHTYFIDDDEIDETWTAVPVFANIRADLLQKKVSPFLDSKVGASVAGDINGMFVAFTAGCRIKHFNIGIGYELQNCKFDDGWEEYTDTMGSLSLKLSFDFGARK